MPCHAQVEWLRERIQKVPVRLVFESALELMGTTQLGSFKASASGWTSSFWPSEAVVLLVLQLYQPCAIPSSFPSSDLHANISFDPARILSLTLTLHH